MSETFFTADTHWGHRAILGYTCRPWVSVEEMDEGLIERWNSVVQPNDVVYHLGDFCLGPSRLPGEVFSRLHGRKHLVKGNHDGKSTTRLPWEWVKDLYTFKGDGVRIVLMHYPMLTWAWAHQGAWHAHGHSHGNIVSDTTRMDVGVDTHPEFRPYSLAEVVEVLSQRTYRPVDHHKPTRNSVD